MDLELEPRARISCVIRASSFGQQLHMGADPITTVQVQHQDASGSGNERAHSSIEHASLLPRRRDKQVNQTHHFEVKEHDVNAVLAGTRTYIKRQYGEEQRGDHVEITETKGARRTRTGRKFTTRIVYVDVIERGLVILTVSPLQPVVESTIQGEDHGA